MTPNLNSLRQYTPSTRRLPTPNTPINRRSSGDDPRDPGNTHSGALLTTRGSITHRSQFPSLRLASNHLNSLRADGLRFRCPGCALAELWRYVVQSLYRGTSQLNLVFLFRFFRARWINGRSPPSNRTPGCATSLRAISLEYSQVRFLVKTEHTRGR